MSSLVVWIGTYAHIRIVKSHKTHATMMTVSNDTGKEVSEAVNRISSTQIKFNNYRSLKCHILPIIIMMHEELKSFLWNHAILSQESSAKNIVVVIAAISSTSIRVLLHHVAYVRR